MDVNDSGSGSGSDEISRDGDTKKIKKFVAPNLETESYVYSSDGYFEVADEGGKNNPRYGPAEENTVRSDTDPDKMIFSESEISVNKKLGEGNFAITYKAEILATKRPVALKVPKGKVTNAEANKEMKSLIEIGRHRNILDFIGLVQFKSAPCFMTDFCEKGSIEDLHDELDLHTDAMLRHIAASISRGLHHLHSRKMVHRDIACRNLLMKGDGTVVIADFGLTRTLTSGGHVNSAATPFSGSGGYSGPSNTAWPWTAPEAFPPNGVFSEKADIYALGITLWEIVTKGGAPFDYKRLTRGEVHAQVMKLQKGNMIELPANISSLASALISPCTSHHPDKRPTAFGLLAAITSGQDPEFTYQSRQESQNQRDEDHILRLIHVFGGAKEFVDACAGGEMLVQMSSPLISQFKSSFRDLITRKNGISEEGGLYCASEFHLFDEIQWLLRTNPTLSQRSWIEDPLIWAVDQGYAKLAAWLVSSQFVDVHETEKGIKALVTAAESGNFDIVKLLVSAQAEIRGRSNSSGIVESVVVFAASRRSRVAITRWLLSKDKKLLQATNALGQTLLTNSIQNGNPKITQMLLHECRADVNGKDANRMTPLMHAVAQGNMQLSKELIEMKADPNARNKFGASALHLALSKEPRIAMWLATEGGASVNARDYRLDTTFQYSARANIPELTKWLVSHRDLKFRKDGIEMRDAICQCARHDDIDTVAYLLKEGAPRSGLIIHAVKANAERVTDYLLGLEGELDENSLASAMHIAVRKNLLGIVKLLAPKIHKGCLQIDSRTSRSKDLTCAHYAAANNNKDILRVLIDLRADLEAKDQDGQTPLILALKEGHLQFAKDLVIEFKVGTDLREIASGRTPLHFAAESGDIELGKFLLENSKCDVYAEDRSGKRVLDTAAAAGNQKFVDWLEKIDGYNTQQQKMSGISSNESAKGEDEDKAEECNEVTKEQKQSQEKLRKLRRECPHANMMADERVIESLLYENLTSEILLDPKFEKQLYSILENVNGEISHIQFDGDGSAVSFASRTEQIAFTNPVPTKGKGIWRFVEDIISTASEEMQRLTHVAWICDEKGGNHFWERDSPAALVTRLTRQTAYCLVQMRFTKFVEMALSKGRIKTLSQIEGALLSAILDVVDTLGRFNANEKIQARGFVLMKPERSMQMMIALLVDHLSIVKELIRLSMEASYFELWKFWRSHKRYYFEKDAKSSEGRIFVHAGERAKVAYGYHFMDFVPTVMWPELHQYHRIFIESFGINKGKGSTFVNGPAHGEAIEMYASNRGAANCLAVALMNSLFGQANYVKDFCKTIGIIPIHLNFTEYFNANIITFLLENLSAVPRSLMIFCGLERIAADNIRHLRQSCCEMATSSDLQLSVTAVSEKNAPDKKFKDAVEFDMNFQPPPMSVVLEARTALIGISGFSYVASKLNMIMEWAECHLAKYPCYDYSLSMADSIIEAMKAWKKRDPKASADKLLSVGLRVLYARCTSEDRKILSAKLDEEFPGTGETSSSSVGECASHSAMTSLSEAQRSAISALKLTSEASENMAFLLASVNVYRFTGVNYRNDTKEIVGSITRIAARLGITCSNIVYSNKEDTLWKMVNDNKGHLVCEYGSYIKALKNAIKEKKPAWVLLVTDPNYISSFVDNTAKEDDHRLQNTYGADISDFLKLISDENEICHIRETGERLEMPKCVRAIHITNTYKWFSRDAIRSISLINYD